MTDASRTPTPIDTIADAWVDTLVELAPTLATYIGRTEDNDRFGDYSPAGQPTAIGGGRAPHAAALEAADPVDEIDRVTQDGPRAASCVSISTVHEAGWHLRDLNVIASPAQDIRAVFDLMPTDTADDWAGHRHAPRGAAGRGRRLHRDACARASRRASSPRAARCGGGRPRSPATRATTASSPSFAGGAAPPEGQLPASLARELADNADAARVAYDRARRLPRRASSRPPRRQEDAVGRELYALQSRRFLGAAIDLDETYEWGVEELARMVAEQESIADEIKPGASVEEAIAFLEDDPARKLHGTDALQRWMQETSDRAVDELGRDPLRHPRADPSPRVHDRADPGGRHLLHRPDRRLLASRPHVVVGARGRHRVRHLARAHHRLPRGRSRSPPADRAGRLQPRRAQLVAPAAGRHVRPRRGLGALRRAPDGAARLPRRPRRPARHARRPAHARGARRARHRRAPREAAPRRPGHVGRRLRARRSCAAT